MHNIAIIGCGLVGQAWVISFLRGGWKVSVWDADAKAPERLRESLPETFSDLRHNGLLKAETDSLMEQLTPCRSLSDAVGDADYVQESSPEILESKQVLFKELDLAAPAAAVLASSTSALQPTALFEEIEGRNRCLVAHPVNPPYLVPAVEIVPAPFTDKHAVEKTAGLMAAIGQAPIVMQRELDGFLINRLQGALLDEAFRLVAEGYASIEDVDIAIREGLALRWSFMGPFETIDLNAPGGIKDYVERYTEMYTGIAETFPDRVNWKGPVLETINKDRRSKLSLDNLKARQDWRDRRLMALAQHKIEAGKEIGE